MLTIKVTHKFLLFLTAIIIIMISNINFITSACIDNDSIHKRIDDVDLPYFNYDDDRIIFDRIYLQKKNINDDHQIIHNNDNLQSFFKLRPLLSVDINYDDLKSDDDHYNYNNNNYYNDHDDHDDFKGDDDYYNMFIKTPTLINIKTGNLRASNIRQ
jgi:hypothetical protein